MSGVGNDLFFSAVEYDASARLQSVNAHMDLISRSGPRLDYKFLNSYSHYSIKVDAKLLAESNRRSGHGTFYVVQDRPIFKRVEEGGAKIQDGKVTFSRSIDVPTFLGKALFRAKGSEAKAGDYGTVDLMNSRSN